MPKKLNEKEQLVRKLLVELLEEKPITKNRINRGFKRAAARWFVTDVEKRYEIISYLSGKGNIYTIEQLLDTLMNILFGE